MRSRHSPASLTLEDRANNLQNEIWHLLSQIQVVQHLLTEDEPVDLKSYSTLWAGLGNMVDEWVKQLEAIQGKAGDLSHAIPRVQP